MTLPAHLFVSDCDGALYDTRVADWSKLRPVRTGYRGHAAKLETLAQVKAALRSGGFAWPGGYPLYFVTRDGAALSFEAVRSMFRQVASDFVDDTSTGWRVEAVDANYEDSELRCDHTGELIPSAYGDDESGDPDVCQECNCAHEFCECFADDDEDEPAQWVAGFNMPGYMPESEPAGFATFDDAKSYVIAELKRAEDDAQSEDDATEFCHAAEDVNLESDAFTTPTLGGYVYWVARAEA